MVKCGILIGIKIRILLFSTFMENFDEYNVALQTAVLNPTKLAFSLPADIAFHKSVDREFAKDIDSTSAKVLSLTNKLLALTANGKGKNRLLENEEDVMDNFHSIVVDAMDQLLERSVSDPDHFPIFSSDHFHRTYAWTNSSVARKRLL